MRVLFLMLLFKLKLCRYFLNLDGYLPTIYVLQGDYVSHHLAPVITKIFNCSLRHQTVPSMWKLANVSPIPKESPLPECNQLRPISLTNTIMRIFEHLVCKQEVSPILKSASRLYDCPPCFATVVVGGEVKIIRFA